MSFTDVLTTRPRGRPPKLRTTDPSPLAVALAKPLPAGLEKVCAEVATAGRAIEAANAALTIAKESESKLAVDQAVTEAQAALARAQARRDVADVLGDSDKPTDANLADLQRAVDDAKAKQGAFAPRIAALREELERRRGMLDSARATLRSALGSVESAVRSASDENKALAMNLLAEVEVFNLTRQDIGVLRYPPSIDNDAHNGKISGASKIEVPEALREAYRTLRRGDHLASAYQDAGWRPEAAPTGPIGHQDRRADNEE